MPAWKVKAGSFQPPRSQPPVAEKLIESDSRIEEVASDREIGSSDVQCPSKYIEVKLLDEHGEPVIGARCNLNLPGASAGPEFTNSSGIARFEGKSIDATKSMLRITENLSGEGPPTFNIEIVPLSEPKEDEAPPEPEDENVSYFRPPWQKALEPRQDGD